MSVSLALPDQQPADPVKAEAASATSTLPIDPGLHCLVLVAARYRVAADPYQLHHELALGSQAAGPEDLVRAARALGLKARIERRVTAKRLAAMPVPAILGLKDGGFAILGHAGAGPKFRVVGVPSLTQSDWTGEDLAAQWDGTVVLFTRRLDGSALDPKPFGFNWFLPAIWRYRQPLAHVFLASLFLQLLALVTPLFFQVVIDKVLLHKGYSTLIAIAPPQDGFRDT